MDEERPRGAVGLYGASKAAMELIGLAYADNLGVDFVALRFSAVYGPGTFVGGSIIGELLDGMVRAAVEGKPCRVRPWPLRQEYTYVEDIARGVELALFASPLPHRVYNLGAAAPTAWTRSSPRSAAWCPAPTWRRREPPPRHRGGPAQRPARPDAVARGAGLCTGIRPEAGPPRLCGGTAGMSTCGTLAAGARGNPCGAPRRLG